MQCEYCGKTVPPERVDLGKTTCLGCAEYHTPTTVVVPMGVAIIATKPPTRGVTAHQPKPPEVAGRFIVVAAGYPAEGFDSLPKAMLHASTLESPTVRDTISSRKGGLGQVYPTPDRVGRTHHNRQPRY